MIESLADQIVQKINQVAALYYRLILVVAPAGAGKTAALQNVQEQIQAHLVNINLALSRQLLELTERQRALQIPRLLEKIASHDNEIVLLDNIEILFDISLKQDPLRLLQRLSRNKTIVAAWNGTIVEDSLIYATPTHSEHKRYPIQDFLVVSPTITT